MLKLISIFFFTLSTLYAFEFTITSYNVENLFDLKHDKSEYKEYIPNTPSKWNKQTQQIKLQNLKRVIKDLDSDVIALQEIESQQALNDLLDLFPEYTYSSFMKNKNSSVGLAVMSKFEIINSKKIYVKNSKVNRPIQEVTLKINNKNLTIFNNHWASKRQKENERVRFALVLQERLKELKKENDYILLGDFNSNYNEYETIKLDKKLNNTGWLTGINHVLNTRINQEFINKNEIQNYKKKVHYNLWFDLTYKNRFSNKYRGHNTTPDNILLPASLFDNKNFSYKNNSFKVFKPNYLYKNKKIIRWQIDRKTKRHKRNGYSDHLPITATFTTENFNKEFQNKQTEDTSLIIDDLYEQKHLNKNIIIKDVTVIYKNKNHAIVKNRKTRAIFLYYCAQDLKLGFSYDLEVLKIKEHYGLKEITDINVIKTNPYDKNFRNMYKDANSINLHDTEYQNEMVRNIQGKYKNKYLYYDNKKIKIYSKDKTLLPNNGQKITIMQAHLGFFKNKAQLIIYNKNDIKVTP